MSSDYLYLHGFASSPQSKKAQFLKEKFASVGQTLHILDLDQNNFAYLTLSRQIQQGVDWISRRDRVALIGSSFGGLTAAWIAQHPSVQAKITRLVLLAPAFQFLAQWLPRLGSDAVAQWETEGWLSVYHYGQAKQLPLAYEFIVDAQRYDDTHLMIPVPTLILHGRQDEVIDVQASRDYTAHRPWVQLTEVDSDHSLSTAYKPIWEATQSFLGLADKA